MDRDELVIPKHIAIIMDGNGRWAKKRGKIRLEGHRAGANSLEKILRHAGNIGVKYLTVYAFSTENWKRPEKEVNGLMDLFVKYLDREKKTLKKQGVKLLVTGAKENISEKLLKKIEETENYLANCENIVFNIAFNYGGRREIVDAVNKVLETKLLNDIFVIKILKIFTNFHNFLSCSSVQYPAHKPVVEPFLSVFNFIVVIYL